MCGRVVLRVPARYVDLGVRIDEVKGEFFPTWNTTPGQDALTIVQKEGKNLLQSMRFGFHAPWLPGKKIQFNARADKIPSSSIYSSPMKSRRVLFVVDGFIEWPQGDKQHPFFVHLKTDEVFALAGIYWVENSEKGPFDAAMVITTEPNSLLKSKGHHRMPVILKPDEYDFWLDNSVTDVSRLIPMLRAYPTSKMDAWGISTLANNNKINSPEVLDRVN